MRANHIHYAAPSLEEISKVEKLCVQNAGQFVKDAELLVKTNSYGHALAFSIFAIEELGKAALCRLIIKGELQIDSSWWRSFYHHGTKRLKAEDAYLPVEWAYAISNFIKDVFELITGKITERKRIETLGSGSRFLQKVIDQLGKGIGEKSFWEMIAEAYRETKREIVRESDSHRERGLYVGFDISGKVISPSSITREEAEKFIKLAKQRVKMVSNSFIQ